MCYAAATDWRICARPNRTDRSKRHSVNFMNLQLKQANMWVGSLSLPAIKELAIDSATAGSVKQCKYVTDEQ